jgi:hypothetical protein
VVISETRCDNGDFGADEGCSSNRSQELSRFLLYRAYIVRWDEYQEHDFELHDVLLQKVAAEIFNQFHQLVVSVHTTSVHERL